MLKITEPTTIKKTVKNLPILYFQPIYPKIATSSMVTPRKIAKTTQGATTEDEGLLWSKVRKIMIDIDQIAAPSVAIKNQAEGAFSFFDEPIKTESPDKKVKTDTAINKIGMSSICCT